MKKTNDCTFLLLGFGAHSLEKRISVGKADPSPWMNNEIMPLGGRRWSGSGSSVFVLPCV